MKVMGFSIPNHIAFIPDGNRRWAKQHGYSIRKGHESGFDKLDMIVRASLEMGVKYFTAYGFSTENWKRPQAEVLNLMDLFENILRKYMDEYCREGIKVLVFGDISKFNPRLRSLIEEIQERSKDNNKLAFSLCLNYGGRDEIVMACREVANDVKNGKIDPLQLDSDVFSRYLYSSDIPDPDIVIRTSGERRLSNFLLWQSAYTELMFEDKCLPDYNLEDFYNSLRKYSKRQRRYGT